MKSMKKYVSLLLALVLCLMLTACGGDAGDSDDGKTTSPIPPIPLRIWSRIRR